MHTNDAANAVQDVVDELLTDGVMTTGICMGISFRLICARSHRTVDEVHVQLLAASSLPLISCSGWKSFL
jgi:hypothetical protein